MPAPSLLLPLLFLPAAPRLYSDGDGLVALGKARTTLPSVSRLGHGVPSQPRKTITFSKYEIETSPCSDNGNILKRLSRILARPSLGHPSVLQKQPSTHRGF